MNSVFFFRFFFQSRLFHDRQKFLHEAPAVASFLIWRTSSVEPFGFSTKSKTESSILQLDLRLVSDEIVEDNSPRRCQPYSSSFKLLESDRFLSQFDFGQDGGRSGSCGGSVSFSFFFSFFFLVIEKKRKNNRTDEKKKQQKRAPPPREIKRGTKSGKKRRKKKREKDERRDAPIKLSTSDGRYGDSGDSARLPPASAATNRREDRSISRHVKAIGHGHFFSLFF